MGAPHVGEMSTGDHRQRLVALAGALAESGVTEVEVELSAGCTLRCRARETDLPGILASAPSPVLRAREGTLVQVSPASIVWMTRDAGIDAALRRAVAFLA